jgi:predicted RNase H-like nuclease
MQARKSKVVGVLAILVAAACRSGGSSGNAAWRVVADGSGRRPQSPMVATTAEAFDAMARTLAMPGAAPIDVGTEIPIGIGVSSPPECLRLVDVKVDIGATSSARPLSCRSSRAARSRSPA